MLITLALATSLAYTPAGFDKTDVTLLTALFVESTFDVMQTRVHLDNGSWRGEGDPILGRHPGALRLWGSFVVAQVGAIGIAKLLPGPWRKVFEIVTLGLESANVTRNIVITKRGQYTWGETMKISF